MTLIKKPLKKSTFLLPLFFIILASLFIYPFFHSSLSCTRRVKANILLVEGWLGSDALEAAYNEFIINEYDTIISSGINLVSHEYYLMSQNGYLIFYPKSLHEDSIYKSHTFEVDAYGQLGAENSSRFSFYVNDSLVDKFITGRNKARYKSFWTGRLNNVDSLMVHFINDAIGDFGDRNLFVKEIIIDEKNHVPYKFNSVYDISYLGGNDRFVNNYRSYAELAANNLLSMGIDSSSLVTVSADKVKLNRTLSSALAVKKWLITNDPPLKSMNIVSVGPHSRRTWMTYRKILGDEISVGIISVPDKSVGVMTIKGIYTTYTELLGLIYYWFILLQY
jgi:hypothetical protein